MKVLLLFGGQGTGDSSLYDLLQADEGGKVFLSKASQVSNLDLLQEIEKVRTPSLSQLLIGIYHLGIFEALQEILKVHEIGMAGYSLGEVSAFLCSTHATLETSIDVYKYRTNLMLSPFNKIQLDSYDLVSIRGRFSIEEVESLCRNNHCEIAIIIAKDHLLLGGKVSDLNQMLTNTQQSQIDRYKFLNVYEPSHTSFYKDQSAVFINFLKEKFTASSLAYPIISPIVLQEVDEIHQEIVLLGKELSTRIDWNNVCHLIPENGYELIVDLGPGPAMTKILKESGARLYNQKIVSVADFKTLNGLKSFISNS